MKLQGHIRPQIQIDPHIQTGVLLLHFVRSGPGGRDAAITPRSLWRGFVVDSGWLFLCFILVIGPREISIGIVV